MRVPRLLAILSALVTTVVTTAVLVAPAAAAEPPMRLPTYVTDRAHALTVGQRATVKSSVDKLYADRHIRLWVVYVKTFSGQTGENWSRSTARLSDLGDYDALLAVAIDDRAYGFLVSSAVTDAGQVDRLRRDTIEPALGRGDWSGAALAASNGLRGARPAGPGEVSWVPMVVALAGVALAGVALMLVLRRRRGRRRAAALAAARRVDPTDPEALAAVPLYALEDLSRSKVVDVDNAVRTSTNELALAIDEFGEERTEAFTGAVRNAESALAQAFQVRQQLDEDLQATPAQRRELLSGVIVTAAKADRELETQREAFDQLRDLVINAASRLDTLTQQLVSLTAHIPAAEQHLWGLYHEFDAAALASVSGNVKTARDRAAFADRNITRGRTLAAQPVTGGQSELADVVRAAESALAQGRALLDAVDNAARDIRHAVAALPAALTDIETGISQADTQLQGDPKNLGSHSGELAAARDAAVAVVAAARGSSDPLGAFTALTKADAALDRLLDTLAEEQATAERLARTLEQALFTAQSRVRGASDYIDTRRGSVGPEARTRLAEARRRLETAQDKQSSDVSAAITDAQDAATLAASAQSLAKADVQSAQQAHYGRPGGGSGDTGAMLGGIIIGSMMGGGGFGGSSGGSGGWSPTSFGGSGGGGGFLGGGGRF